MSLKNKFKSTFASKKDISQERFKAAKFSFIMIAFLFFLNFYFVWAGFYSYFFSKTLWMVYILLLLSILFFFYFLAKMYLIDTKYKFVIYIVLFFLIIFFLILLVPLLISK